MTCLIRYGVAVPHVDGRVGMAALEMEIGAPAPDMARLYAALDEQLPPYAHPRFVRLLRSDGS